MIPYEEPVTLKGCAGFAALMLLFAALAVVLPTLDGNQKRIDAAREAARVECLARCGPNPVEDMTTKADGSLGCICDESRVIL